MRGHRKFDGRYFVLADRGTKEHCVEAAKRERARGNRVRVVPWNPWDPKSTREALDDYAVFTFPLDTPREVR